ncbi:MAG TPA: hypothetical protein VEI02_15535 [Planctomycetota bacterium]|nr:hypothetical protein [Planctomycetota bacterium]
MSRAEALDFVRLLNAARGWTVDAALWGVLPPGKRDVAGLDDAAKRKALVYLHNNAQSLRRAYDDLESGAAPDFDALNPVLESAHLRLVRAADGAARLTPVLLNEQPHPAIAHLRLVVQRAFYAFARYAERRLADPAWPDASPQRFRVRPCATLECDALATCPDGESAPCDACAARLEPSR